ncbi:GRAM domain-containing protein 2A isoform X2 [Dunckerocampus dactyliophorus]|uniref:GRAM domain-containing protein 2A isoform X2 n=1 Tax=Dunckerocampus dactyliophorus TaxID=161453 RepID=UPI0024051CAF|nr:GRAM domain-containing protein 2A isoform X2 [Dunckerocampus dactyliophorus]
MADILEQSDEVLPPPVLEPPREEDVSLPFRLHVIDDLSYEDVKKCYRGSTVNKYNSQYHKLFQTVPKDELLMKDVCVHVYVCVRAVYSCALLRDILLQGRLYISRNWLCFYANLFGKDIKVCIPVVSVRLVKKHKTAGLVPNGLAITMDTGQKVNGKSLSVKEFLEEPSSLSMDEFPEVAPWTRTPSLPTVSSSLPDLLGDAPPGHAPDTPFMVHTLTEAEHLDVIPRVSDEEKQLLKVFILLVTVLVLSSSYLAYRVCRLEQQLSFLTHRCGEVPCWAINQRT